MSDETISEMLAEFRTKTTVKKVAEKLSISKEIVARRVKELVACDKLKDVGPEERAGVKGVRPRQYQTV